jgi:four helix bundle protein
MGSFRKLKVWHEASALTVLTYKLTGGFPKTELYGLTSQMRRAAVSVTSNIAEGRGRNGDRELARFLRIALGSLTELDSLILVSKDLGMSTEAASEELAREIRQVRGRLSRLLTSLNHPSTKD